MRFAPRPLRFGKRPGNAADDETDGLPTPQRVRLQARRAAGIAEAKAVLACLPVAGESLHAVVTARLDLTDVMNALLERLGVCERLMVATLGYNQRNLKTMLAWLDQGAVGSLSLVASLFFRSHNGELWTETLAEFRNRKQRAACCHSHAKVVTLAFASGERLSIEGSANLCGNGSGREQFALIHDAGLHDFHAGWIAALLDKHEGKGDEQGQ
jgi:voltage-gated potassium channel Kch